jgi:hypothetical protein
MMTQRIQPGVGDLLRRLVRLLFLAQLEGLVRLFEESVSRVAEPR